jgi:hypothetical protein
MIVAGQILICIGTAGELASLAELSQAPQRSAV